MSFRKTRVHLTGKSNADGRTITTSPIRTRPALHEKTVLNSSALIITPAEDPIEKSILKYKSWNKKLKTESREAPRPDFKPKHDPPDYSNVKKKVEVLRNLQDQKKSSTASLSEQFSKFIQSSGIGIKSQFIKADKRKKGNLTLQEFKELLESLNAPSSIASNSQKLFEELGGADDLLDYREFNKNIAPKELHLPQISSSEKAENFRVIDKKSAPPNQLENIFNYGKRLRQYLKIVYKTPENLVEELDKTGRNDRISVNGLKDFILGKLAEDGSLKITQRELEGFLASYDYNKDQDTSVKEVAKYVFLDDLVAANYLHIKKRAIPPLRDQIRSDGQDTARIKRILLDIEHKVFTQGPNQTLAAFKMFDKDGDGYLTVEDVEQGLSLAQIKHSPEDTLKLFNFLDDNQNGFVTFAEFSKVIQPNIITINREKLNESEEQHLNISQPSTSFYTYQKNKLPDPPQALIPETVLKVPNRYSSSPPFQNTFTNFAPSADSAMFLSDKDRYTAKKFEPTNLHHEDKNKVRKVAEGRIEYLKKTRQLRDERVKEIDDKERELDGQKVMARAKAKYEYEAKCKMGMIG